MEANLLEDAALLKLAWVCLCALEFEVSLPKPKTFTEWQQTNKEFLFPDPH